MKDINEKLTPVNNGYIITDIQKALVNKELEKIDADPNYLLDWDEVKSLLKF